MEKLSIFKIEDAEIEDTEALRVELFPGEDPEDAVTSFTSVVFQNSMAILYHRLKAKLGDKDVWEANGDFTDCIRVTGTAERVKVPKEFYRFTKNSEGKNVKAKPARIVKYAKLVAFKGGPTLEEQLERYLAQVPDNCWVEKKEEEEED